MPPPGPMVRALSFLTSKGIQTTPATIWSLVSTLSGSSPLTSDYGT